MGRHDRQSRLTEVGLSGQERIAASTIEVQTGGLAAEVATRYLAGAGVGRLLVRDGGLSAVATSIDPAIRVDVRAESASGAARAGGEGGAGSDEPLFDLRDPAARDLALGAREALRALRALLDVRANPARGAAEGTS
jgi:hypothetical protein